MSPPSLTTDSSPHVLTEVVVIATGGWGPRPMSLRRAPVRDGRGLTPTCTRAHTHTHIHTHLSSVFSKKSLDMLDSLPQVHQGTRKGGWA